MIKEKQIKVIIAKGNKKHYINCGYNCKVNDEIIVNIEDVPLGSKNTITAICDYCREEKERRYCDYNKNISGTIHKYACSKCRGKKIKESNLQVYGVESIMQLDENKNKIKQTCIKKYGCAVTFQAKEVKDKVKQTMIRKYGVENISQLPDFQERIKKINLKKYGKEYFTQTDFYKSNVKQTNLNKYGVENVFQLEEFQEKQKQTCIEKYGCENVFQNEEVKEKIKETMLDKYGVEHIMQDEEYKNIVIEKGLKTKYKYGTATCSKQQEYIWNLIGGELNYPVDKLALDIAFPNEMIYVEYNGSGHDIDVKYGRLTEKEFKYQEIKRYKYLKSLGWKQIEINSHNDFLIKEPEFLKIINDSKNSLINTNIFHITININEFDETKLFKLPHEIS